MGDVPSYYVRNVKGLLVSATADCDMIAALVEEYVETISVHVEKIKDGLNSRLSLEKSLRFMVSLLNGLGARWLQNEAENILHLIPRIDKSACDRKVMSFIANLLALSIEMQTAKHHAASGDFFGEGSAHTIEYYTDIQRNLETVRSLTKLSDYRSALDIVENMTVLQEEQAGVVLTNALKSKRDADNIITELIGIYQRQIDNIRGEQVKGEYVIVLVDDRPDILETVSGYLRDTYKVFALTGGMSTLRFLDVQKPDLFVLDIDMPDMDGITLARKIRDIPEHKKTPIMILTSNATKEYLASAMAAGVDDFLVKPANRDLLTAKISKFLS